MEFEYILEKGSGKLNEDHLIAEGNIFGVFDGSPAWTKKPLKMDKACDFLHHGHEPLDPECSRYSRLKPHDDIAAIAIQDPAFSSTASPLNQCR